MPAPTRVLALRAHPDDIEFQRAGTLALLARGKVPRHDGDHDPRRLRQRRAGRRGNHRDPPRRGEGVGRPDRGRLPLPRLLASDACFCAPVPNHATRQWEPVPPWEKIPHLDYVDPIEGADRVGRPQPAGFHIDVTRVFETKRRMFACHASRRNWLVRQHGIDEYLDSQATWSARRESEIGVAHAEAFRQDIELAYPHENLGLKRVGQDGKGGTAQVLSGRL
jgi:hypothetical protein